MRSTLRERWSEWKYATERALAPHVEEAWAEDFLVELRLQGVDGAAIGEALSEVESHCAESGETARDSFGDPSRYAVSLGLPRSEDDTTRAIAAAAAPTVVQVGAMLVTIWAFSAWAEGDALAITSGQVLSALVLAAAIVALICFSERSLRLAVTRPLAAFVTMMVVAGLSAALPALVRHELGAAPALPVLLTSAAVLLAGAVWGGVRTVSGVDDDLVTSPIEAPQTSDEAAASARLARILRAATSLVFPVVTLAFLALTWWMAQQ